MVHMQAEICCNVISENLGKGLRLVKHAQGNHAMCSLIVINNVTCHFTNFVLLRAFGNIGHAANMDVLPGWK